MASFQSLLTCTRRALLCQPLPATLQAMPACSARSFTSAPPLRTSKPSSSPEPAREDTETPGDGNKSEIVVDLEEQRLLEELLREDELVSEAGEVEQGDKLIEEGGQEGESGEPKINTWFLDPSPPSASSAPQPRQPLFTTFDRSPSSLSSPSSSSSSSSAPLNAPPLPSTAPPNLLPLHAFLTSHSTLAGEVLLPHTVQFFDTRAGSAALEAQETPDDAGTGWENAARMSGMLGAGGVSPPPPGLSSGSDTTAAAVRRIRKAKSDASLPESGEVFEGARGETFGPAWEWVGVVQVKGRGRGVVARADGVVRRWLLQNPVSSEIEPVTVPNPKTPRIDPDADWSIVPVKGTRICINLLTEEGRVRWRLEEMWGDKGKRARGSYPPGVSGGAHGAAIRRA